MEQKYYNDDNMPFEVKQLREMAENDHPIGFLLNATDPMTLLSALLGQMAKKDNEKGIMYMHRFILDIAVNEREEVQTMYDELQEHLQNPFAGMIKAFVDAVEKSGVDKPNENGEYGCADPNCDACEGGTVNPLDKLRDLLPGLGGSSEESVEEAKETFYDTPVDNNNEHYEDVDALIRKGMMINAIKTYRSYTNLSLKEAKMYCDDRRFHLFVN